MAVLGEQESKPSPDNPHAPPPAPPKQPRSKQEMSVLPAIAPDSFQKIYEPSPTKVCSDFAQTLSARQLV